MKNNKYEVIIEYQAQIDLKFWQENDKKKFKKINRFITECEQNPYTGICTEILNTQYPHTKTYLIMCIL